MNDSTPLSDEIIKRFHQSITNLWIEAKTRFARITEATVSAIQEALAAYLAQRNDERDTLVRGITRALADPAHLQVMFAHLKRLQVPLLPYEEEIPDDRIARLLRGGPSELTHGELAWLALVPEQLEAFGETIRETMTPFWVDAIEEALEQAAHENGEKWMSTTELFDNIRERIPELQTKNTKQYTLEPAMLESVGTTTKTTQDAKPEQYDMTVSDNHGNLVVGDAMVFVELQPNATMITIIGKPDLTGYEVRLTHPVALAVPAHYDGRFVFPIAIERSTAQTLKLTATRTKTDSEALPNQLQITLERSAQ